MSRPSLFARSGGRLLRSRRLMRAPIWIYRVRVGALFGSRILMLEHIGRKSGAPRYAVLEVVDHPASDTYVVASGFGRKDQWFRNIQALARCRGRHLRAWQWFKQVLEETLGTSITDTDTPLPMVEQRPD